jgi:hypothetical protein
MSTSTQNSKVSIYIDSIHGKIKLLVEVANNKPEKFNFDWCCVNEESQHTGFMSSISDSLISVTPAAAEHLIRIISRALILNLNIQTDGLKIFNHLGETISDIQFLPPTFEGKEEDVLDFIEKQESIQRIYSLYEKENSLSTDLIEASQMEGVLEDILSLIQFKITQLSSAFKQSKEKTNG